MPSAPATQASHRLDRRAYMANPTSPPVETISTGADKAKLAVAAALVVGAVVAFYALGQQDLWLRVAALFAS